MDHSPKVITTESLRTALATHFRSLGGELPIAGGWGYGIDDAILIDPDHPAARAMPVIDAIGLEYTIVEKRLYEELIIRQPQATKHSGIRWSLVSQRLRNIDGKHFDQMVFEVEAFLDADFKWLAADWGQGLRGEEAEQHAAERQRRMRRYQAEYWFDISLVFGRR